MTSKNDLKISPTQYLEEAANLPGTIVSLRTRLFSEIIKTAS